MVAVMAELALQPGGDEGGDLACRQVVGAHRGRCAEAGDAIPYREVLDLEDEHLRTIGIVSHQLPVQAVLAPVRAEPSVSPAAT